jgi:hypothetical protein
MAAAGFALGFGLFLATRARRWSAYWIAVGEITAFVVVGSMLSTPSASAIHDDVVTRGRVELMTAFDPEHLRSFDYRRLSKLDPASLLEVCTLNVHRAGDEMPDEQGRVAGPIGLPPGRYQAQVWFASSQPQPGDLLLLPRRGNALARRAGPLPSPATMTFDLPARVPVWLALSEPSTARRAQRIEIAPLAIVPRSHRLNAEARAVEAIEGRENAYIVYVNSETYPEGGVFWTRAANRGEVLVSPAGASDIVLTLYVGPTAGTVHLDVGGQSLDVAMRADEIREVSVPVSAGASLVPVSVQASAWFRPAAVDPRSSDTRALGCQVRIGLR